MNAGDVTWLVVLLGVAIWGLLVTTTTNREAARERLRSMANYYERDQTAGEKYVSQCQPGKHRFEPNGQCFVCRLSRDEITGRAERELRAYKPEVLRKASDE